MFLDTASSRPWWKHPLLLSAAGLVALRLLGVLVFRTQVPAVMDRLRAFNKHALNPAMLHLAGRPHWYAARVEHVGRRSGRAYATPVIAQAIPGGFTIPLPYGTDVDWRRNVTAAGGGVLEVGGVRHTISGPCVVDSSAVLADLPPLWQWVSRIYRIQHWLTVSAKPAPDSSADGAAHSAVLPRGTTGSPMSTPSPASRRPPT
ncbi:hypothetical protein ACVGVM_12135 [Pseudonocardia bannensis]|uniref:hypothetical protein n=1 Tax=Pseudonocardia bannensis TaxID=630973 RepID=UPI001B7D1A3D|nr:hypothetical protein [Pseudonocardia bannensis]